MAFVQRTNGDGLVRDDFPHNIARNASEPDEWPDLPPTSRVPNDFESLFDWITVKEIPRGADSSRKHEVVHVPRPFPSRQDRRTDMRRFTIRIFGMVGNCNLSRLGNWDRTVPGCTKAIQFITICPGAFMKQFEDQKIALSNVRQMIYKCLNEAEPRSQYRDTELFFHRKVFNVANRYGPRPVISDTCVTDEARLDSISSRWNVAPQATYARRLVDNSLKRCNAMIISPGDFVDVTATVDIVSIGKTARDRKTNVHFAFTRVVRLLSGKELIDVAGPQIPTLPQQAPLMVYEDRLPFEDEAWDADGAIEGAVVKLT